MNDTTTPVAAGPIRPSLTLIGAEWFRPDVSHVVNAEGRRQVELVRDWRGVWFTMTAYLSADEARQIAERFTTLADEIEAAQAQTDAAA